MAHQNKTAALFQNIADGGKRLTNAGVVGDLSLRRKRNVEVDPKKDLFSFNGKLAQSVYIFHFAKIKIASLTGRSSPILASGESSSTPDGVFRN